MNFIIEKKWWIGGLLCILVLGLGLYFALSGKSVSALAAELRGSDPHLRHEAARKLAKLGEGAKGAVSELGAALSDPDQRVRFHSAKALSDIGVHAKPVAPEMIAAVRTVDAECRYYLVKALSKLDLDATHSAAVPGLIETLKDQNAKSRYYAVKCLKEIGPAASAASVPLRALTNDPDPQVREVVASALKKVAKKS